MSFKKKKNSKVKMPPCVICSEPSVADQCWGNDLCETHWGDWHEEAPTAGDLEKLSTPDEIEKVHKGEFLSLVVLRPEVLAKKFTDWTSRWIAEKRLP